MGSGCSVGFEDPSPTLNVLGLTLRQYARVRTGQLDAVESALNVR